MKKITWIPLGLLTMILVAGFIVLQSSGRTTAPVPATKNEACTKNILAKCTPVPESSKPSDMLMESVSRQFLMIR